MRIGKHQGSENVAQIALEVDRNLFLAVPVGTGIRHKTKHSQNQSKMRLLMACAMFGCILARAAPCLPREAFVSSPVARVVWQGRSHHGSVCAPCRAPARTSTVSGGITRTRMVFDNMPGFSGLFGRIHLQGDDDLSQQRQELNRLHAERDYMVEKVKRTIRAASYDMGEQDWYRLFSSYDKDANGMIDFVEFERLCRQMGLQTTQMSIEEMNIVFEEVDSERRGSIEVTDFTRWLSGRTSEDSETVIIGAANYKSNKNVARSTHAESNTWLSSGSRAAEADNSQYIVGAANNDNIARASSDSASSDQDSSVSVWTYGSVGSISRPVPEEIGAARTYSFEELNAAAMKQDIREATMKQDIRERSTLETLTSEIEPFVGMSRDRLREVVYFFLNEIGLPKNKVMGLALAAPDIFLMDLEKSIRPQVQYLKHIGVPVSRMGK